MQVVFQESLLQVAIKLHELNFPILYINCGDEYQDMYEEAQLLNIIQKEQPGYFEAKGIVFFDHPLDPTKTSLTFSE